MHVVQVSLYPLEDCRDLGHELSCLHLEEALLGWMQQLGWHRLCKLNKVSPLCLLGLRGVFPSQAQPVLLRMIFLGPIARGKRELKLPRHCE